MADWAMYSNASFLSGGKHDLGWNKTQYEHEPQGNNDEVIEVAQDRNEVRDEIDGAKGISSNEQREQTDEPRSTRVTCRKVDDERLLL